jgi:hypothetical protein
MSAQEYAAAHLPQRYVKSTTIRKNNGEEFQVLCRDQFGKRWPEADYFTIGGTKEDLADARATAKALMGIS